MISEFLIIFYGLLTLFLIFILLRLSFFGVADFYKRLKTYAGVMIEGSEIYWFYKWKKQHRKEKISYENIDIYNLERGWTLAPNLKNNLNRAAVVNSSSEGIRGTTKKSKKSALFFGDSFCFGEGVDDGETIPSFFEKNFKDLQALNFGVHGYGIDQQYLYLKKILQKYNPQIICFVICDNDFRRNFMEFRDYAKPKFVLQGGEIILKNSPVPEPEEYLKKKPSYIFRLFPEIIKHFFVYYGIIKRREQIKINSYILENIKSLADKSGAKLFFIYIGDLRKGFVYKSYFRKFFPKYFTRKSLNYLDLEKEVGRRKFVNLFDSLSGHLSPSGNKLAADKLAEMVKEELK